MALSSPRLVNLGHIYYLYSCQHPWQTSLINHRVLTVLWAALTNRNELLLIHPFIHAPECHAFQRSQSRQAQFLFSQQFRTGHEH